MRAQGHQKGETTHERKDADVINLAMIATLLLLSIAICLLVCWGILRFLNRERNAHEPARSRVAQEAAKFPPPRLLVQPGSERKRIETTGRAELESYGWVDRPAGIARIPIRRAMQLIVERGLPEVGAGQTRLQLMQVRPPTDLQPNEPIAAPPPEVTP